MRLDLQRWTQYVGACVPVYTVSDLQCVAVPSCSVCESCEHVHGVSVWPGAEVAPSFPPSAGPVAVPSSQAQQQTPVQPAMPLLISLPAALTGRHLHPSLITRPHVCVLISCVDVSERENLRNKYSNSKDVQRKAEWKLTVPIIWGVLVARLLFVDRTTTNGGSITPSP
jgi:hypothetical protein